MGNELQRVDVVEALASWCNEKNTGRAEYDRRCSVCAAVAELIESTAAEYAAQAAYDNAATGKQRNETWDAVLDARKRRITAFLNAGGSAA